MNELKEKQQTAAMGWQMEADDEIEEAKFWRSGLWVVSRRTRSSPAPKMQLCTVVEKKAFEGYGFYPLISALSACFKEE